MGTQAVGVVRHSLTRLSLKRTLSSPITLNTSDTLKLTFEVLDKKLDNGVQPRFYHA
jgi:hypothetical protein